MELTDEIKKMIDSDINACIEYEKPCAEGEYKNPLSLFDSLKSKYINIIDNFDKGIPTGVNQMTGGRRRRTAEEGIRIIRSKLEANKANNYIGVIKKTADRTGVVVNNIINNNISIDMEISQIIQNIKNDESLSPEETNDILSKINEVSNILKEGSGKTEKWAKLKDVLLWLIDKGVNVAIQILPLILSGLK